MYGLVAPGSAMAEVANDALLGGVLEHLRGRDRRGGLFSTSS